ncbi:TIGR03643 family protein [Vreelandella massiliensis]|uniref:TIGR03643 family protein n=1 Tax=Vreelandella massiliensis TaxID=1816686 RepID=UPI00096A730A|nr:TIGR03643 family protein [Halomonas massiliensis]MYL22325.1 TIGR03643 family protein [Halomonas alkaliantarctica]
MSHACVKRFHRLPGDEQSRLIEMAWEDRTPFEAIETLFGLTESDVIKIMRHQLKPASFRLWRQRVSGRNTKHRALRSPDVMRGYCPTQYKR